MSGKAFVDTNILVYAEDADQGRKHEIARGLVLDLWEARSGVLSVQILQEFFVVVTRRMRRPLTAAEALVVVEEYLTWGLVENTGALLLAAIELGRSACFSFWDALVVAAAQHAGCSILYSEDLQHGQRLGELTMVNPFI